MRGFPEKEEIEEECLAKWVFQLQSWGFPPLVSRVRLQAEELLRARGDCEPLGIHWIQKFLSRHDDLRSTFATQRDQERVNAVTYSTVSDWFRLVEEMISIHKINQGDVYNMDEKGIQLGIGDRIKALVDRDQKTVQRIHTGNRNLVTIIECICADGTVLHPSVVFEGARRDLNWGADNPATARRVFLPFFE